MDNIMVPLDVSRHFLWIWEKPRNFSKSLIIKNQQMHYYVLCLF
jgi:hypothetical protein